MKKRLSQEIEQLRQELYQIVLKCGGNLLHPLVLEASRKLDQKMLASVREQEEESEPVPNRMVIPNQFYEMSVAIALADSTSATLAMDTPNRIG